MVPGCDLPRGPVWNWLQRVLCTSKPCCDNFDDCRDAAPGKLKRMQRRSLMTQVCWDTEEEVREAKVSTLHGQSWRLWLSARTTGAELRAVAVELAGQSRANVVLQCGSEPVADDDLVFCLETALMQGKVPHFFLVHVVGQRARDASSDEVLWP
mmetsp:Transcript_7403/g.15387  ORF Transcript_7403/g.15387 Transcript_7403/m.15387 type:complete len:154 (-) Transcript_7403:156-617(-)